MVVREAEAGVESDAKAPLSGWVVAHPHEEGEELLGQALAALLRQLVPLAQDLAAMVRR